MTKQQLEARIAELEEEDEDLQSRLDSITDIATPEEEELAGTTTAKRFEGLRARSRHSPGSHMRKRRCSRNSAVV